MISIAHLSDLHFGRDRPELLEPLLRAVNGLAPDLVVISGDLTQRARQGQFRAARAFLDRLDAPWLAVPGNHDVPLDRPFTRLLRPYGRYRRWIGRDLAPEWRGGLLVAVGLNTVNPLDWQRGRLGSRRIAALSAALAQEAPPGAFRIVVAHHPVVHLAHQTKALLRGADRTLAALAANGADAVLSGHLHNWRAEAFAPAGGVGRSILMVQAGTGLSTRLRGEENDFNLLTLEGDGIDVRRYVASPDGDGFRVGGVTRFGRGAQGWRRRED